MHEISEEVSNVKEEGSKGVQDILRVLSQQGMYSRNDSLDMPSAIMEILRLVRTLAVPGTPLLDDTVDNVGRLDKDGIDTRKNVVKMENNGSLTTPSDPISRIIKDLANEGETKIKNTDENIKTSENFYSIENTISRNNNQMWNAKEDDTKHKEDKTDEGNKSTKVFRPWGLDQEMKGDNPMNRTGMGLLPTPPQFKYIEESYLGMSNKFAQALISPLHLTPRNQNIRPTEAPNKPSKVPQQTPITLPGPVPSRQFMGPALPSTDDKHVQGKVPHPQGYHVPPPEVHQPSQATSSGSQLTPKTLELMGYKKVNDHFIRCDQPKPKKSRWS